VKTLFLFVPLFASSLPAQQYYHAFSLGVLPGYTGAEALSINSKNSIVGYSFGVDARRDGAFLWTPDSCKMIDLGSLGGGTARATAINDFGLVVGHSANSQGMTRAFAYSQGVMSDMGGPSTSNERALSVNNAGHAAGSEDTPGSDPGSAVLYTSQGLQYLPSFQGKHVLAATGINEYDELVGFQILPGEIAGLIHYPNLTQPPNYGWYRINAVAANPRIPALDLGIQPRAINRADYVTGAAGIGVMHAFLSKHFFQTIDLGTLNPSDPGVTSVGMGLDSANRVVGFSEKVPSGGPVAFLHDGSTMIDLNTRLVNPAGWELMSANAINDNGWIVGTGRYNGQQVAVVLVPTLKKLGVPPNLCTPVNK
jgi:probable HAF family extracellular repeat protein